MNMEKRNKLSSIGGNVENKHPERIEVRNSLLKRKREMETEITLLLMKAKILQEVRHVRIQIIMINQSFI